MRRAIVIAVLCVIVGVVVSLFLIPAPGEMALIYFRDKNFEQARVAYEEQLNRGEITPEVVSKLVDLQLQQGDVDGAVNTMERFIAVNPNDLSARQRLGHLYQYAQRPDDYLKNLEAIQSIRPSAEVLAELSDIYNARHDYDKQITTLQVLVNMEGQGNAKRYRDLANIQAVQQARADAINTLLTLATRHPAEFQFQQAELLVSLLLDEKRTEDALTIAHAWRWRNPPAAESARLINLLHYKGSPELAQRLMDTYSADVINAEAPLLEQSTLLMLSAGQETEAYTRLKTLYDNQQLSTPMQHRLLFLALTRGETDVAQSIIKTIDLKALGQYEATALLDLAVERGDKNLLARLKEAFSAPEYRDTYPLFSALMAVATHADDADALLGATDPLALANTQLIQGARVCLRMNHACSTRFLNRLPEPNQLNDADALAVAALYFDLKAYDKGAAFLEAIDPARRTTSVELMRARFAAARGDASTAEAWLDAHGKEAGPRVLKDLFFVARNHKHHRLASRVAFMLYEQQPDAESRSLLATSYVDGGQYAEAVALLRENRELTAADESNYLLALTKLAGSSAEYRRELGAYAGSRLNASLPHERKMALIYALVRAGQVDVAMPYIRALALKNGGQWAWLYASELTKRGQHREARDFWVTLANQPSTSPAQREAIAHNLLAGGYDADALPIFESMAAGAPVGSKAVRQLLYLWGPRMSPEQLEWAATRFNEAPDAERGEWAKIIAERASAQDLIGIAEGRHPELLFAPRVLEAYVAALAERGRLASVHPQLFRGIQEYGNPELIRTYARAAGAAGATTAARDAWNALAALQPNHPEALREAGLLDVAGANYSGAERRLGTYLANATDAEEPASLAAANYYYAEALRHAHQPEAATYYSRTVDLVGEMQQPTPEALSQRAQAMLRLGDTQGALGAMQEAVQRFPSHEILAADYAALLVEAKEYDAARNVMLEPMTRLSSPGAAPDSVPLPGCANASCVVYADSSRVVLRLTSAAQEDFQQLATNVQTLPWVSYTSEGYRQLMIAAKPGYALQVSRDAMGNDALVAVPAETDTGRKQLALRYHLLAARMDLEQGSVHSATERLNALMPHYPNDPQLLGFAANAENYGGNWARAQALLNTVRTLAPENEDIALLRRDIRRDHAPSVKLDHEWVKRGDDRENITTLSAEANASENLIVGAVAQHNRAELNAAALNKNSNQKRVELYAIMHGENGQRGKVSLYSNGSKVGAGASYEFLNPLGETGVGLEVFKPFWELDTSAVVMEYTRDRVSLWHTFKPTPRWSLRVEPALNRYHVGDRHGITTVDKDFSSWSVDANVVYRPIDDMPYLYLAYGLSKEDATDILSLRSGEDEREAHFVSVNTGYEFSDTTYASALLGYGYDRITENGGPMVEGRLNHEFTDELDAQLRAAYGFDTSSSGDDTMRLGGYVRWKF